LATIDDIVFHTNEYIEMQPGGVGVFLLLGVLVPISWIFYKKVRYIVFSIIPVATYLLQGLIVGNLRYIWGAIALELGLIVISVSILLDCVKKVQVRSCGTVLICLSLTFPNIFYIYQNFSWRHMLAPNCEITECKNRKVLKSVPEGARVLSINDSQKGDYQGFYFELTWRNIYILNKIIEREYLLSDFVKGFDYVLYSKDTAFDLRTEAILRLFGEICDDKSLLEKVEETADHILYQVKNRGEKCIILEKGYEEGGQRLANGESLDFYIEEKWPGIQVEIEYQIEEDLYPYKNIPSNLKEETSLEEKYQLSEQLENLQKHTCELWMGVRWNDQSGQMLQYDNVENYCYSTQNSTVLGPIAGVEDAQSANISIKNVDDTEIVIKNIKILGNDTSSIIDEEIECYFSRQLLKQ